MPSFQIDCQWRRALKQIVTTQAPVGSILKTWQTKNTTNLTIHLYYYIVMMAMFLLRERSLFCSYIPHSHWLKNPLAIGFCAQWRRFSLPCEPGSKDSAVDTGMYRLWLRSDAVRTQHPGERANFNPFPSTQPQIPLSTQHSAAREMK